MLLFERVLELSDLMEDMGADPRFVDRYRNLIFQPPNGPRILARLLLHRTPGRKYFSLARFLLRYAKYPHALLILPRIAKEKVYRIGPALLRRSQLAVKPNG